MRSARTESVGIQMVAPRANHTLFSQVIRLLVHNTGRPPLGLGLFGVTSGARGRSWWGLATVVGVSDLLARLDELDECLGYHAAVKLLEVLQCTFVVAHNLLGVSNAEGNHFIGRIREVLAIRALLSQAIIRDGKSRGIALATSYTTRGCVN